MEHIINLSPRPKQFLIFTSFRTLALSLQYVDEEWLDAMLFKESVAWRLDIIFKIGDQGTFFFFPYYNTSVLIVDFTLILRDNVIMGSFGRYESASGSFRITLN